MIRLKKILSQKFLKISNYNGGEGGIEPRTVARCWFSRPVLSTAQPPLQELLTLFITIKVNK